MKLKKSKYNIFVEAVCLVLLVGIVLYLFVNWNTIPDKIPGHYNAAGETDRVGDKVELVMLPIVSWLMYIGFTIIDHFPQIWNTGVTVTDENRERVYRIAKNMLSTVKLIMVVNFVYLAFNSSKATPLPVWFLPVFLGGIFGSLIFFTVKLVKAR